MFLLRLIGVKFRGISDTNEYLNQLVLHNQLLNIGHF